MKISLPQIVASAVAAVVAALVASFFGVTGTVVGVAVGSAVATAGTALFRHSIERTNEVVRQVVAGSPTAERLTRPLGRTRTAGTVAHARTGPGGHGPDDPTLAASGGSAAPATSDAPAASDSPATAAGAGGTASATTGATTAGAARLISTHIDDGQPWDAAPARPARTVQRRVPRTAGVGRRIPWPRYAGVAAVVAVLALGLVTGVELVAGEPLSSLLGVHGSPGSGPSVSHLFGSSGPTTTTTTSTPSSSTTTSTTGASGTTTTGASGSTSTIASAPGTATAGGTASAGSSTSTTSTTRPAGSTTTTTSSPG